MDKFYETLFLALFVGFGTGYVLWSAEVAWFEQGFVIGGAATMAWWGWRYLSTSSLHPIYLRDNPGPGMAKAAVWLGLGWCVFTIAVFGSERIFGIWYFFYLLIGLGAIYAFGVKGAETFGVRIRPDVYERKNVGAAMFISAFTLATGLIYGGSMWGESDEAALEYGAIFEVLPSYEDGWWIIMLFFAMGWGILFITMKLWFWREKSVSGSDIRRNREVADGRAAALYCLGCAIPLTDAVSGDYHGLEDSLISFGVIALPVLAAEVVRPPAPEADRDPSEPWVYILAGIAAIALSPIISTTLGFR